MPGRLFEVDDRRREPAHHRGAAAGRHERGPERAGAVRRPDRRIVELAGAHPDAAGRGAHFGVRVQGHRTSTCARSRPQLGATHVLEGSLRRSGDQLRITVQLIAADTGLHIWSRSFDRPIGDIFQIEDTVSRAVAEKLHLELTGGNRRAVGAAPAGNDGSATSCTCSAARARAGAPRKTTSSPWNISAARCRPIRNTCRRWSACRSRCSTASR